MRLLILICAATLSFIGFAEARGKCDGLQRCRCGVTAARLAGLPLNYNGLNLKMARAWYALPRTTCHAGAVGIPHAHHVYTVLQCNGDGTALIKDDAGTYTRRVAGNVFVDPNGNRTMEAAPRTAPDHSRTYSARSHRHHRRSQVAQAVVPDDYMNRFNAR